MDKSKTRKVLALSTSAVVGLSAATIVLLQEPGTSGQRLNAVKSALSEGIKAGKTDSAARTRLACSGSNSCRDR
ncbi:MAG: hypothetical protein WB764_18980 [Xanthobacteraceae bacterium]